MNEDLKIIKKKYGEKMERFCRDNFSTILENTGQLSKLLLDNLSDEKKALLINQASQKLNGSK